MLTKNEMRYFIESWSTNKTPPFFVGSYSVVTTTNLTVPHKIANKEKLLINYTKNIDFFY
jgi:hypothetical protein